jgi:hypothetical protein
VRYQEYGDEFFMKAGAHVIALFSGDHIAQSFNPLAAVDDFREIKKRLVEQGFKIYKGDMVDGPDGIRTAGA